MKLKTLLFLILCTPFMITAKGHKFKKDSLEGDKILAKIRRDIQKKDGEFLQARQMAGSIDPVALRGQNFEATGEDVAKASKNFEAMEEDVAKASKNFEAMEEDVAKASKGKKKDWWNPFDKERKAWGTHNYMTPEQMERLAYEQQQEDSENRTKGLVFLFVISALVVVLLLSIKVLLQIFKK